jgi:hypothetical protein
VLAVEIDETALIEALLQAGRLNENRTDKKAVQSAAAAVLAEWTEQWQGRK